MKHKILGAVCAVAMMTASTAGIAAEKVNIGAPAWTGAPGNCAPYQGNRGNADRR